MDYEFLLSAPPKLKNKFQDMLYIDDDDDYEQEDDEQGGLDVISEQENESSQQLSQLEIVSEKKYIYEDTTQIPVMIIEEGLIPKGMKIKLKTFRQEMLERQEQKKQLEKQFKQQLREQTDYLLKQQKQEQIKSKLVIKNIEPAIKEMLFTSQIEQPKTPKLSIVEQKVQDKASLRIIDDLKAEITKLKFQHQNDEELVKTLKIQIKKQNENMVNSTANTSTTSISSKSDYYREEVEKLQLEIAHLKKTLFEERENFKTKMGRANKVNAAIYAKKQEKLENSKLSQENSKTSENTSQQIQVTQDNFIRMSCQIAELRNQIQRMNEKVLEQEGIIKQKDKEILSLVEKLEGKQAQRIENKIQELQEEIINLKQELTETKESMMIDNQLSLLFPQYGQTVLNFMNLIMRMEESNDKKAGLFVIYRYISNKINSAMQFGKKQFQKIWDYIVYRFSGKDSIKHPTNQELIRLAVNKIRANPTLIEKKLMKEEKTSQMLKQNIDILEKQIEQFKQNQKDTALRHKEIEMLHRIDKIDLANNIMMRIMKKEAQEGLEQSPELKIIKQYIDLIYKDLRDTDEDKIQINEIQQQSKSKSPKKQSQTNVKVVVRPISSQIKNKIQEKPIKKVEQTNQLKLKNQKI